MNENLIYDVGMNNGDDAAYYLFKGYRVLAIEADPTLVERARIRFAKEIEQGRLTLLNCAIAPTEGVATFWICEGTSEWNSFDKAVASRLGNKCHGIDVQCRRFKDVLAEHATPRYLKIDIEGYDHYCLEDLDRSDLPTYISLELSRLEDLITLRDLGYNAFKVITQNDHTQLRAGLPTFRDWLELRLHGYPRVFQLSRPLLAIGGGLARLLPVEHEGNSRGSADQTSWKFLPGSSGPFGEETDGEWEGFTETAYACLGYWLGYSKYGPPSLNVWHDMHATRRETEQTAGVDPLSPVPLVEG